MVCSRALRSSSTSRTRPPSRPRPPARSSRRARNLLQAEATAGVRHHVALSVVGTDRLLEMGYFGAKLVQEQMIASSGLPYSIVHATQFFEFLGKIADASTDGATVRLPSVLFQPMASGDVAYALAGVAR